MTDHIWRCPNCIREIDLSVPEGKFAKASHEKSHQIPASGPRHAKPKRSSGSWADAIGDFVSDLFGD